MRILYLGKATFFAKTHAEKFFKIFEKITHCKNKCGLQWVFADDIRDLVYGTADIIEDIYHSLLITASAMSLIARSRRMSYLMRFAMLRISPSTMFIQPKERSAINSANTPATAPAAL
mgnify:CR=1 FL=1